MGRAKFLCAYCNKSFEDSQDARKRHFSGRNHKANVRLWYESYEDQEKRAASRDQEWKATAHQPTQATTDWQHLPPSMIPAPPEAFTHCRTDWG